MMTARKPGSASWENWVEEMIREAQERGEFDNLPGKGKPLKGIDQPHDELWWVKEWLRRENVSITPPSIAIRKATEEFIARLGDVASEELVRTMAAELNTRIREVNRSATDGPPSNLMPMDVERVVEKWRTIRRSNSTPA